MVVWRVLIALSTLIRIVLASIILLLILTASEPLNFILHLPLHLYTVISIILHSICLSMYCVFQTPDLICHLLCVIVSWWWDLLWLSQRFLLLPLWCWLILRSHLIRCLHLWGYWLLQLQLLLSWHASGRSSSDRLGDWWPLVSTALALTAHSSIADRSLLHRRLLYWWLNWCLILLRRRIELAMMTLRCISASWGWDTLRRLKLWSSLSIRRGWTSSPIKPWTVKVVI